MSGIYSYRWQRARLRFLQQHPLCVLCARRNVIAAANVVDHVVPHRGDLALFWDVANWQSVCKPCHDGHKQMVERGDKVEPHASWS